MANETEAEWLQRPVSPHTQVFGSAVHASLHKYDLLCQVVGLTTATLLIFIRIYTKARILKNLGGDDCESSFPHAAGVVDPD